MEPAGGEVGQDHGLVGTGEDVGALGHEVDAAEEDELGVLAGGGFAAELEGVAAEVGELDDVVALVVVAEDDEAVAEEATGAVDAVGELGGGEVEVVVWDVGLPGGAVRLLRQGDRGDVGLAVGVGEVGGQACRFEGGGLGGGGRGR